MDPSSLQPHQEIMESESLESMLVCTNQSQGQKQQQEKKPRPTEEAVKCPRCDSTNTKFCYYNNYSLSQPRYFCKSCKRYWTQGGTLRNIPVGGGCRKNRRTTSSPCSSSSSLSSSRIRGTTPDHHPILHPETYGNINSLLGLTNNPTSDQSYNPHFALLGNSLLSLDDRVAGNALTLNPLGFGLGSSGNLENVENGGGNSVNFMGMQFEHNQEMMMMMMMMRNSSNNSSASSTPTRGIKHELGENRLLWGGLPWQVNNGGGGEGNYIMNINGDNHNHESDLVRQSWSNGHVLGSSWHNLLNSPLI